MANKTSNSNTGRACKNSAGNTSKACSSSNKTKSCSKGCKAKAKSEATEDCSHTSTAEAVGLNQLEFYKRLFKQMAMGEESILTIKDKVEDKALKRCLSQQQKDYKEKQSMLLVKINALHGEPEFVPIMQKIMLKSGVAFNTMVDTSASKIAEIMIQGINMGVIAVTRLNNQGGDLGLDTVEGSNIMKLYETQLDCLKNYL